VVFLEFFPTGLGEGIPLGTVPGGMCVFVLAGTGEHVRRALCLAHFIDGKTSPLLAFSPAIDPLPA